MHRLIKNRFVTKDPIVFEDATKDILITQNGSRFALWFDDGYLSFDNEKNQYTATFECPLIKNIVLCGASFRGVMYPGVIEALEEFKVYDGCQNLTEEEKNKNHSFLDQIETFPCASIGSVISYHVASGIRSAELKRLAQTLNFNDLLGEGWAPTNPFTKNPLMPAISRNAKPLYHLMQTNSPNSIYNILKDKAKQANLDDIDTFLKKEGQALNEDNQIALKKLNVELNKIKNNEPPAIITFAMLHALHCLYPIIFKDLYVSVSCRETGEACYLSWETAPDLEIARACLASAAIPGLVSAVKIDKKYLLFYKDKPEVPEVLHFVDGGYFDNSSYIAVDSRQKKEIGFNVGAYNQNLQTLVILPDDTKAAEYEGDMDEILSISTRGKDKKYQQSPLLNDRSFCPDELAPSSFLEDIVLNFVPRLFGLVNSKLFYTKIREEKLFQLRREFSQRIIPINSGVTALDHIKAQIYQAKIIVFSKNKTLEYLQNHHLECVHFSYNKITDLIKDLPEEKYQWLKKNSSALPMVKKIDFRKIDNLRYKHRQIPVSLCPKFNNFMRNFHDVNKNFFTSSVVKRLQKHFFIISTDESASDDVKMLRALSAIFDNLTELSKTQDGMQLLSFFTNQFGKYIRALGEPESENSKEGKVTRLIAENIKEKFYRNHDFHAIYQRIAFILHQTKSSIINPEDLHQRSFIETIINDIKDLAALSMNETNKLKKLEEYIYQSYLKVIYYKGSDKTNLGKALKKIIKSEEILNLPYLYGIKLPSYLKKYPKKITPDNERDLDYLRNYKCDDFFNTFANLMDFVKHHSFKDCTFKILYDKTCLFMDYDSDKKQTIYQIMIKTLLYSPVEDDRFYARKINDKITKYDFDQDKIENPSLMFATSLLVRLTWVKPSKEKITIYDDLVKELNHFIYQYRDSRDNQAFESCLTKYLDKLKLIESKGFMSLFHYHSDFYKTLKNIRDNYYEVANKNSKGKSFVKLNVL